MLDMDHKILNTCVWEEWKSNFLLRPKLYADDFPSQFPSVFSVETNGRFLVVETPKSSLLFPVDILQSHYICSSSWKRPTQSEILEAGSKLKYTSVSNIRISRQNVRIFSNICLQNIVWSNGDLWGPLVLNTRKIIIIPICPLVVPKNPSQSPHRTPEVLYTQIAAIKYAAQY